MRTLNWSTWNKQMNNKIKQGLWESLWQLAVCRPWPVSTGTRLATTAQCVVCLSDVRDTLILPCTYLCLCQHPAPTPFATRPATAPSATRKPGAPLGPRSCPLRRAGLCGASRPPWLPMFLTTCFLLRSLPGTAANPSHEEKLGPLSPAKPNPILSSPDLRLGRALMVAGPFFFFLPSALTTAWLGSK